MSKPPCAPRPPDPRAGQSHHGAGLPERGRRFRDQSAGGRFDAVWAVRGAGQLQCGQAGAALVVECLELAGAPAQRRGHGRRSSRIPVRPDHGPEASLGTSTSGLQWVVDGYNLAVAAALPAQQPRAAGHAGGVAGGDRPPDAAAGGFSDGAGVRGALGGEGAFRVLPAGGSPCGRPGARARPVRPGHHLP
jgi:hypothetical protein